MKVLLCLLFLASSAYAQSTIIVPPSGNLQAAINSAQLGDTIVLQAGAEYRTPGTQESFVLTAKSGTCNGAVMTTITTSALANLAAGRRVTAADKVHMAKIVALGGRGAIQIAPNAGCWKLVGLEVTNSSSGTEAEHVQDLLGSVDSGYSRLSKPAYFTIDRSYIHPQEDGLPTSDPNYNFRTASHGVAWNVAHLTITNSRLSGFIGAYRHGQSINIDSEAIAYSTGPGPLVIHNNFIDAWYAGLLTGGADTDSDNFGVIASAQSSSTFTITVQGGSAPIAGDMLAVANIGKEYSACKVASVSGLTITCIKPLVWNGSQNDGGPDAMTPAPVPVAGQRVKWRGYVMDRIEVTRNFFNIDSVYAAFWKQRTGNNPKGFIEFKNGNNILLGGNIFDGYPSSVGFGLQNQSGSAPWSSIRNVTLRNNLFRRFSYAFGPMSITGYSRLTERGTNILITNNLAYGAGGTGDINGNPAAFFTASVGDGPFTVTHNTVIDNGPGFTQQFDRFTGSGIFKDNILYGKEYGNQCLVEPHITSCFGSVDSQKNLIVNNRNINAADINAYWWANSIVVPSMDNVNFTNPAARDYRLLSSSPGFRTGTDGKDIGVDVDALNAALGGAQPLPTPIPSPTVVPSPTATPSPTPVASPSVTPTPLPSPTATPTPFPSPTSTPTPQPTPTPLPPTGQVTLSGKTFYAGDGSTFAFTVVILSDVNGNEIRRIQEGDDGRYSFNVTPGNYQLHVVQAGYNISPSKIVLTNIGTGTSGLSILNFTIGPDAWFPSGPVVCVPVACTQPSPTPTPTPSPTPIPPSPTPTPIPPTPTPTPVPPTPTPTPTPTPSPIPCSISAPISVTIPRNSEMGVDVVLSNLSGSATVSVSGSDGQVTVTPLTQTAIATNPYRFRVRVKRQSRTITFNSPCGAKAMRVNVP